MSIETIVAGFELIKEASTHPGLIEQTVKINMHGKNKTQKEELQSSNKIADLLGDLSPQQIKKLKIGAGIGTTIVGGGAIAYALSQKKKDKKH